MCTSLVKPYRHATGRYGYKVVMKERQGMYRSVVQPSFLWFTKHWKEPTFRLISIFSAVGTIDVKELERVEGVYGLGAGTHFIHVIKYLGAARRMLEDYREMFDHNRAWDWKSRRLRIVRVEFDPLSSLAAEGDGEPNDGQPEILAVKVRILKEVK